MNTQIIRFTLFKSDPLGNGADRRTAQISDLLNGIGIKWERIPTGMNPPSFSKNYVKRLFKVITLYIKVIFVLRRWFHPVRLYKTVLLTSQFKGVYDDKKEENGSVIFWETTKSEYSFVVPFFKQRKFKIIALPHNLESLVPDQRSGITNRVSPNWFMEEIRVLKKCDQVFAISPEDTLLLKQFGIKAAYLPYYPSEKNLEILLEIRNRRETKGVQSGGRKKVLMLGSALNPPTRQGMEEIIDFFSNKNNFFCDLIVAGYGTAQLKKLVDNCEQMKLLGDLTLEELSDVLFKIDMVLVHQPPTSGALTRIVEMMVAGVPVLSNFEGARSYYNIEGVNIYMNKDQLSDYLKMDLHVPPIPQKPLNEILNFNKVVLSL